MIPLDELQRDALREAFNIGIGQAAASLSDIVREPVALSVLALQFLTFAEARAQLAAAHSGRICAVSQEFSGAFSAVGLLIFPERQSLEVVRLMVNEALSLQELTDLEQDAMGEIGNILLNACTGAVAEVFASRLHSALPVCRIDTPERVLRSFSDDEAVVMLLHIDLMLEKRQLHGVIAFMLNGLAMQQLIALVDAYLARLPTA